MALKFWVTTPFFYSDMDRPWGELLQDMLTIVDTAERLGFEGVAINENVFQNYVANPSALAFAALAAARTTRLRILPGVVVLPSYNPLLIASEMAMLDHLAPGRVGIGVARGGGRYQLDRIGVDPAKSREIYEEALEIIQKVWVEDNVTYEGRYFSFPRTTLVPKPASQPGPDLWVASQSVDGVRKVAAQGHNLLTAPNWGNFEPHGDLEALLEAFNTAAAESGSPRGEVMVYRHTWLGRTETDALEFFDDMVSEYNHYLALTQTVSQGTREDRLKARGTGEKIEFVEAGRVVPANESPSSEGLWEKYSDPVLTTADKMIERFKQMEAMGVDHLACLIAWGQPIEAVVAQMELMAEQVLPAFAEDRTPSRV
ncbi:Luciferase-like, subgroup [Pseudonocardia dioxanivorans CB1190]|jgi:alkanesulfonate monooxygenase SsuD/methylene tetrahydromethanopterin reductase-like flavin-dependent oxidoreductase (luciferase family)|uniref:Luciferase-like, subgroup n=4 Tax=Pseudonocardia TaxID=1847 RepID=F4CL11_PSEUX|nr:LLM class flavin-dependent oxidoreductase [Pseudonocardia dioxanivorans]AEA24390.1 Luciferase-like, subgroup [Pseudonocardia dioxanivorans CB1190]